MAARATGGGLAMGIRQTAPVGTAVAALALPRLVTPCLFRLRSRGLLLSRG